jgi:adenylosuccinate synthase
MKSKIIIGANFGDEGKGLMTDYMASNLDGCFVVRFNGGAQSGHTVVTPQGNRHVFSHFGSGSYLGRPTYLSKYFLVNPLLFMKELGALGFLPEVFVDENCLVSTPYDMIVNQLLEESRGSEKHGSCGVGFGETIEREEMGFGFRAKDLETKKNIISKLEWIAEDYYPERLKKLGLDGEEINLDLIIDKYYEFTKRIKICDCEIIKDKPIVFEGAQGLLLDQNHKYFPHVTRSNTGCKNAICILKDLNRESENVESIYVTRFYMTRHGRGPFPTEITSRVSWKEETNTYNDYQEHFRFGVLDLSKMAEEIKKDVKKNKIKDFSIAVTCLDQANEGEAIYILKEKYIMNTVLGFIGDVEGEFPGVKNIYISFGNTRDDVRKLALKF